MVWQRFAKSPRIACAGSSPAASATTRIIAIRVNLSGRLSIYIELGL